MNECGDEGGMRIEGEIASRKLGKWERTMDRLSLARGHSGVNELKA
jgi:hypothetical protein